MVLQNIMLKPKNGFLECETPCDYAFTDYQAFDFHADNG